MLRLTDLSQISHYLNYLISESITSLDIDFYFKKHIILLPRKYLNSRGMVNRSISISWTSPYNFYLAIN
jgi:hypothetical protein